MTENSFNNRVGWKATSTSVVPLGDIKEHDADTLDCWCGPFMTSEGIIVHNSADKREFYEPDTLHLKRKPS